MSLVPEIEIIAQKIAKTKTVVLKTRLDSNMVRLHVEGLKQNFFAKLGFLKPKTEDVQLIGFEKYYEPYIVIGGKYSLDYCRKHDFKVEVNKHSKEVFIAGRKFKPVVSKSGKNLENMIHLEGEEYAHYEKETFFVLDRLRRELLPESFSFAPYDVQLEGTFDDSLNFRKVSVSVDEVIDLLRYRIAKRPSDLAEIIRELFEINENTIVYKPFFELTIHNIKTNKCVTLRVDGVTGETVQYKLEKRNNGLLHRNSSLDNPADFKINKQKTFPDTIKQPVFDQTSQQPEISLVKPSKLSEDQSPLGKACDENVTLKFPAYVTGEVFLVGDNVTAVVGDLEIPSGTTVNETLVVKGELKIGDNCRLFRKVKVLGDVMVGLGTVIDGDVISGGNIVLGSGSVVGGCVRAAGQIKISEKVVVGKELKSNLDLPKDSFDLQMIVDAGTEEALV